MTRPAALQGLHAGKRQPQGGRFRQLGATLVELMFAIFIFAVLTVIAVPSFRDASLGSRLTATANSLHGSIQIARSEAIKANATTTLCASSDGASCADVDWDQGWIVLDANDAVIHSEPAQPAGYRVVEGAGVFELSFQPIGVGASAASFVVCRDDPVGSQERVVTVTATGIAHVTTTETGDCP
jgi:type IV fimbrial biogenesis protein FimT